MTYTLFDLFWLFCQIIVVVFNVCVIILICRKCDIRKRVLFWFIICFSVMDILNDFYTFIETLSSLTGSIITIGFICKSHQFIGYTSSYFNFILMMALVLGYLIVERIEEKQFWIFTGVSSVLSTFIAFKISMSYEIESYYENEYECFIPRYNFLIMAIDFNIILATILPIIVIILYFLLTSAEKFRSRTKSKPEFKTFLAILIISTLIIEPLPSFLGYSKHKADEDYLVCFRHVFKPIVLYFTDDEFEHATKQLFNSLLNRPQESSLSFENTRGLED